VSELSLILRSDTQDKFGEAAYFLDQMRRLQDAGEPFKYSLNAFISAARSITYIMQTEYAERPGFTEWWTKKQTELRADPDMDMFNEKRVITIHKSSLRVRAEHKVEMTAIVRPRASLEITVIRADGRSERVTPREPFRRRWFRHLPRWRPYKVATWFFDDVPDRDLMSLCERHLAKLRAVVEECSSLFGSPSSWTG
jgi:hypothetical protein